MIPTPRPLTAAEELRRLAAQAWQKYRLAQTGTEKEAYYEGRGSAFDDAIATLDAARATPHDAECYGPGDPAACALHECKCRCHAARATPLLTDEDPAEAVVRRLYDNGHIEAHDRENALETVRRALASTRATPVDGLREALERISKDNPNWCGHPATALAALAADNPTRDPACSDPLCSYRAEIESGYYVLATPPSEPS